MYNNVIRRICLVYQEAVRVVRYNEKRIKKSELLQLILLDNLYAQSGSERIIFQGGTALRWVYGGMRFSEDLDFVTDLPREGIENILAKTFRKTQSACIAQFGPGQSEHKQKGERAQATRMFFIYRPQTQRERIAVKLEFEFLRPGHRPQFQKSILRDLPLVAGLITEGKLIVPYSSSIILAETPEEILSDKIRALYERKYIKGRDIYDIWSIRTQLKARPNWITVKEKLVMYQAPFVPARGADYFQRRGSNSSIIDALRRDLPRFLPQNIISMYQENDFSDFIATLKEVTLEFLDQGMAEYFKNHERRKSNS
jgi:predicted nucleotidyltransferase component of viral defense system